MVSTLIKHKRARPAQPTTPCPWPGCTTMPCTPPSPSTQHKRARRPAQPTTVTPTAAVPQPDWSSLTADLVRRVGERVVAADDIDYYMAFRAVCHNWRRALKDNNAANCTDDPTCFQPSKWAVLDRHDDHVLALVNLETGRFLRKRLPLLRDYFFVGAASGGLLLLAEPTYPYRARLLNPFTGALARFKAPVPVGEVREVAVVATSPTTTTVFVSMLTDDGAVMWADQDSKYFGECAAPAPYPDDGLLCMVPFAGDVYLTNRQGAVLSTAAAAVVDDDMVPSKDDDIAGCRSVQSISMATAIPEALLGDSCHYYLVESGGELLLVTRPAWCGVPGDQLSVHRVDTVRNVLEPVRSIGNRALFLSRVRCVSVDADKFPAVQGGCIYFVDQLSCYFDVQFSFMTVVRFPHEADGVQQPKVDVSPIPADCFQPFTLAHVFANYCKFVQCSELRRQIMIDGEEDFSDDDEEDSDDDEDYFSDDDDGSDGGWRVL
ncbi:unnamed protein product [Miscanthus lutarioriparius]|uniref:KIB1-4 beta-propeller domain-containing protein n=1 Tax=Miscanthus lutarioriparius TaxID=422564 RepID=A0A811SHR6_9POAL|nr:unnamed protein product [Miscanthus lutarioriparius]